ncbi:MAG: SIMPL domain-containing protein [Acidobacteriota bacterium]
MRQLELLPRGRGARSGALAHRRDSHRRERIGRHLPAPNRLAVVACVVALILAAAGAARAQEPGPIAVPTIVTSGEAIVRRPADVAYIALAVESRARNPRDAQRANADAMSAVQRQLAMAGIARDAMRTLGLGLHQEFDDANGRRVARDFVARNTLEVRIDEVTRAGEIADAAVQGGATALDGIRFDLKDHDGAEREALRLAVADARGRAEAVAAGAGRSVDRILRIEEARSDAGGPRPMAMMRLVEGSAPTAVEPGQIEIRGHVTLTVSMK